LQQSVTKEDRIKAYRAHQNRMARENEIVTILYKNGRRGGEADFEAATRYFLASANLWLLSQTDKPPANRNNVSPTAATEMKQMRAAARDAYQAVTASYEAGTGKLDDVYLWSKRWMQAEIDSGPAGDAKKFYGEHQQRMQQLNAVVSAKHRVGAVGGEGELFTAVTFYLAEADFLLAHLNGDAAKEAKAVVAAAGDAFDAWAAEYAAGKTDVQQACLWSRRWLHASLAASLPHQTADLDHRNRIEKLYDDVAAKRKAAEPGGMPDAVAVVQFYLAEANLLLAEHADDKTPTDPAPPAKAEKSEKGTSEKIQQPAKSSQDSSFLRGIDIVVQRAGGSNNTTNGLPEELGPQIAKLRGVDHVVGGLLDMVSFPDQDDVSALLYGLPPGCSLFERLKIQSGRQLVAGDKNKIMLGRELARRLDKKVGDQVELYGAWSFEVIGIYESPIKFENSGAVLPLAKLQQMMNRPGEVTGFNVVAKRPIDEAGLKDLAQRIELYAASLHRDDGSPLQLKAAPVGRGSPKALK
jgi:hypothetical protein